MGRGALTEVLLFPVEKNGARIRLREWSRGDANAMHRWIGDADVTRYLTWGTDSLSETETYLETVLDGQRVFPRVRYFLAIETQTDGVVIGDAGFTWTTPSTAEIGYFLEPDHWGKGLGVEAARLVIALATELGATEIAATCFKDNWRSERVMQACGLERQAHKDRTVLKYARSL